MGIFGAAVAAGVLVGWLRGGSLVKLGNTRLRAPWLLGLLPISLIVELYIGLGLGLEVPSWILPVHVTSLALVLPITVMNWDRIGFRLLALGVVLNGLVIAANGGLMPQAPETIHVRHAGRDIAIGQHPPRTKNVLLPRERTRLWWLSDVLATPPWFPYQTVGSVGDIVIAIGLGWTVQELMQPRRRSGTREYLAQPVAGA